MSGSLNFIFITLPCFCMAKLHKLMSKKSRYQWYQLDAPGCARQRLEATQERGHGSETVRERRGTAGGGTRVSVGKITKDEGLH